MDPLGYLLLVAAGLAAGFIAGLIGVGGGIIFAPVLFFYYQAIGVDPAVVTQLTIGSSLLCTLIAALMSTWVQHRKGAIVPRVALQVGVFSAVAVIVMTRFVTTQPWYNGTAFRIAFSLVLLFVVARMILGRRDDAADEGTGASAELGTGARADLGTGAGVGRTRGPRGDVEDGAPGNVELGSGTSAGPHRGRSYSTPLLAGAGTAAGAVASAAGVGGGVVLVPAYNQFLGLPIHVATGTSSATIVLISIAGVINYAWQGWHEPVPALAVGYVDFVRSLMLAVPAMFTANIGVRVAHRINQRALRLSFAGIAVLVAVRLLWGAIR